MPVYGPSAGEAGRGGAGPIAKRRARQVKGIWGWTAGAQLGLLGLQGD